MREIAIEGQPSIWFTDELTVDEIEGNIDRWIGNLKTDIPNTCHELLKRLMPACIDRDLIENSIKSYNSRIDAIFAKLGYLIGIQDHHWVYEYESNPPAALYSYAQLYVLEKYDEYRIFLASTNVGNDHDVSLVHPIFRRGFIAVISRMPSRAYKFIITFAEFIATRFYYSIIRDQNAVSNAKQFKSACDVIGQKSQFGLILIMGHLKTIDSKIEIDHSIIPSIRISNADISYSLYKSGAQDELDLNKLKLCFNAFNALGVDMMCPKKIVCAIFEYIMEEPYELFNIYMEYIGNDKQVYDFKRHMVSVILHDPTMHTSTYIINACQRNYISIDDAVMLFCVGFSSGSLLVYIVQNHPNTAYFDPTLVIRRADRMPKSVFKIVADSNEPISNDMLDSICSANAYAAIGDKLMILDPDYYNAQLRTARVLTDDRKEKYDNMAKKWLYRIYNDSDCDLWTKHQLYKKARMYKKARTKRTSILFEYEFIMECHPTLTYEYLLGFARTRKFDQLERALAAVSNFDYVLGIFDENLSKSCSSKIQANWVAHVIKHGKGSCVPWNPIIHNPRVGDDALRKCMGDVDVPDKLEIEENENEKYIVFNEIEIVDRNRSISEYDRIKQMTKIDFGVSETAKYVSAVQKANKML